MLSLLDVPISNPVKPVRLEKYDATKTDRNTLVKHFCIWRVQEVYYGGFSLRLRYVDAWCFVASWNNMFRHQVVQIVLLVIDIEGVHLIVYSASYSLAFY